MEKVEQLFVHVRTEWFERLLYHQASIFENCSSMELFKKLQHCIQKLLFDFYRIFRSPASLSNFFQCHNRATERRYCPVIIFLSFSSRVFPIRNRVNTCQGSSKIFWKLGNFLRTWVWIKKKKKRNTAVLWEIDRILNLNGTMEIVSQTPDLVLRTLYINRHGGNCNFEQRL